MELNEIQNKIVKELSDVIGLLAAAQVQAMSNTNLEFAAGSIRIAVRDLEFLIAKAGN